MHVVEADFWFVPLMGVISLVGLACIIKGLIALHKQKKDEAIMAVIPISLNHVEQLCDEAMALAEESKSMNSAEGTYHVLSGAMQGLVTVHNLIGHYCYTVEAPRRKPLQSEAIMCLRALEYTLQRLQRQRDGLQSLTNVETSVGLFA